MPESQTVEEIWVSVTEAAQITGYNRRHMLRLATQSLRQPENERIIKVRKRTMGLEMWLPDLVAYIKRPGFGPYINQKKGIA
jgi:hypothetical protein